MRPGRSSIAAWFCLLVAILLACAASFSGFYQKWQLREGYHPRLSVMAIIDGDAARPFVYRRLLPAAALLAERNLSADAKSRFVGWFELSAPLHFAPERMPDVPAQMRFSYFAIYCLAFFSLLGAAFLLLAAAGRNHGVPAAAAAVILFLLLLPVLQTKGGYFYDFSELMFLAAALALAPTRWAPLIVLLAVPATYNKESFLFFLPALLPFLWARYGFWKGAAMLAAAGLASLLVYLMVRAQYAGNPGGTVEVHWRSAIEWYLQPGRLLMTEMTYGVRLFAGYSLVTALVVYVAVANGWHRLSLPERQHLLLVLLLNLPLFLLFARPGEMRNLSLVFPGVVLLLAASMGPIAAALPQSANRPQ